MRWVPAPGMESVADLREDSLPT